VRYKGLMNVNYRHFWPICPLQTPNSCLEDAFKASKKNKCQSHTYFVFHSPLKSTSPSPPLSLYLLPLFLSVNEQVSYLLLLWRFRMNGWI